MLDLSGQSKFMFALSEFPFVPAKLLLLLPPAFQLLRTWQLSVVHVCVRLCLYICAVQATISLARCRYIDSFTHITLLSAPLAPLFCSCAVHLTVICSFTHTPCRAELPSGSYVYLTKNAGMPIKRAQKVFLNMEQVLWLGNTSRIATLCEKGAHWQHCTILFINLHHTTNATLFLSLSLPLICDLQLFFQSQIKAWNSFSVFFFRFLFTFF